MTLPAATLDVQQPASGPMPASDPLTIVARQLSESHTVSVAPSESTMLLDRLDEQSKVLKAAYQRFKTATKDEVKFSYAGEWMLDNFYSVEQTLRLIREDMPPGFYRQLPVLSSGELSSYPRIFAVAWAICASAQYQLDPEQIAAFVEAYQQVTPLTMGELWALPTMLRLGIIDKLAGAVARITSLTAEPDIPTPALITPSATLVDDTLVANCFTCLHVLSIQDWAELFEKVSTVEQILRRDPAGVYGRMDFETRNKYRRVIEQLARASRRTEEDVARRVVEMAARRQPTPLPPDHPLLAVDRAVHVGYYLIDEGRAALIKELKCHFTLADRWRQALLDHPISPFLGGVALLTALMLIGLLAYVSAAGGSGLQLIVVAVLTLIPAVTVAVVVVNWLVTHSVAPRTLPRLDFSKGIPEECSTMVVVPTLLTSPEDIDPLLQELELHYLRNNDPSLTFALLTDFADAPTEHLSSDEALIERVTAGIRALNDQYENKGRRSRPFYFFHRARQWNPSEEAWMGWERKRGKLGEFNLLLGGSGSTSYITQEGDLSILPHICYVITLDVDTILPQGSASRLVATLAHPLNRAVFAPDGDSVVAGYTILQPRVEIKPISANTSLFARIFAGDVGLDLYTQAVSDVYQDLFGEGTYVGKGIYDVAAFERSLRGCVPDNSLLSHDLFEGIQGRAALVTDISLFEDYPSQYLTHVHRLHRWIRGDWQLLPWLLPRMQSAGGSRPCQFSVIDRWKIIDNLRRSLLMPSLFVLLIAGWLGLPGSPLVYTLVAVLTLAFPLLTHTITSLAYSAGKQPIRDALRPVRIDALRWLLALIFLPHEALLAADAIITTLGRMFVTRKHLLRWTTSAHTARLFGTEAGSSAVWNQMVTSIVVAAALGFVVAVTHSLALPIAAPFLVAWIVSPQVAYWISRPLVRTSPPLSTVQQEQLRLLARRTWLFFEQFVGPDDHWLPPDHVQESPRGIVAHHTSPTNIGLLLLSILAAYDLGHIGLLTLSLRLNDTFEGIDKLERYRGHLLNWYDTQTLAPLPPRYVSTVDSGNLAGGLLALREGCLAMRDASVMSQQRMAALLDNMALVDENLSGLLNNDPDKAALAFHAELDRARRKVIVAQDKPDQWAALVQWLHTEERDRLSTLLMALLDSNLPALSASTLADLRVAMDRLQRHVDSLQYNLDLLLPWLVSFDSLPALFAGTPPAALATAMQSLRAVLPGIVPTLGDAPVLYERGHQCLTDLLQQITDNAGPAEQVQAARVWCTHLAEALDTARLRARTLLIGFQQVADQAEAMFQAMDFTFLFDEQRQVFHIGYNVNTGKLDNNYYDLLASEARLASLICIARGDVPRSHWLHLGRPVTEVNGIEVLLSWSGTMFEYLMPRLLMRDFAGTFLSQTDEGAVDYQIAYGRQKQVPWGISESGFYAFDAAMNYQYRAFGAPRLGFKRGLADDLVIAPYASLIALGIRPQAVVDNMTRLHQSGAHGHYGFYESVDYTESRLPPGQKHAVVRSYMAHHQGMILLSLVNYLADDVMVRRFHSDLRIRSVELLLQEKIPQQAPVERPNVDEVSDVRLAVAPISLTPWQVPVDAAVPQAHILAQGGYSVLVTSAGGGYSQWNDAALTRWQADTTLDDWGTWFYVQDRDSGDVWSAAYQPTGAPPDHQEVQFFPHKVEFRRRDHGVTTTMSITVTPDEVEIRRLTLTNDGGSPRKLRLTSYGEVVLAPLATDQSHPAFNKMFIESEYVDEDNLLLFRRRPRTVKEDPLYMVHVLVTEVGRGSSEYETDRARFVGRGQTLRSPQALHKGGKLTGTVGSTLDPIFAFGLDIDLDAHATVQVAFLTLAASSRDDVLSLARRYQTWPMIEQGFDQARAQNEIKLRQLGIDVSGLEHVAQLLSMLLYPSNERRAAPDILAANAKGQSGLWAYGISGDYPILLAKINDPDASLMRDLLQATAYWHSRQIKANLVILNQQDTGYSMDSHNQLYRQLARAGADAWLNQRDGVFLLRADQIGDAERVLLDTVARVVLDDSKGSLADQLAGISAQPMRLQPFLPTLEDRREPEPTPPLVRPNDLQFDNGLGGFSADGREYVVYLERDQWTPQPWINVVANEHFGFLTSESGAGFTWAENSGENRLTSWRNDPVSDAPAEALYLRDEETAFVWSPTPLPARDTLPYLIRHGAGYSIFEHQSCGLNQHLRVFAAKDAPIKVVELRVRNLWNRQRRITVTYYAEWVLGTTRAGTQQYVIPEFDGASHALLAHNRYNVGFGERVAFLASNKEAHGLTADRTEFLGRMGSLSNPAALARIGLAGTVQPGLDPCAAIQLHVDLAPGAEETVFFLVGEASDRAQAIQLIKQYQETDKVEAAWQEVTGFWDDLLTAVVVQTPDPAMDLLLNRWLLYQSLSCRVWGRTALYQSSGAFGYRDQLQDVMAAIHARPDVTRQHLLEAARHQFAAGDVLHWWHPPSGRGIRSRISDDLLWLPYVTAHYVELTGDTAILSEKMPFLDADPLKPDEDERYAQFAASAESYTLYEHCRRALRKGSTAGAHGLPLMGTGDWNDGMNLVGAGGKGESVWLAWFLVATLQKFASLCDVMNDAQQALAYHQQADTLRQAIEATTWDGEWFRRAYYDDGSPLGSKQSGECQIDSIAQSWAVLSGAGDPQRASQAMDSVEKRLVNEDDQLLLLLTPPFDKTARDPGYIKGYVPGIRENGGQYTHAALWAVWAIAGLDRGDKAEALFRLLNPIYHADTPDKVARYRVEPYVVAADVYSIAPHTGRGGWTWYTGSAAWMYRLGIEAILGINREGNVLKIDPCIPAKWSGFDIMYRYGTARYVIHVENSAGINRGVQDVMLDGNAMPAAKIALLDDGQAHQVRVRMGRRAESEVSASPKVTSVE